MHQSRPILDSDAIHQLLEAVNRFREQETAKSIDAYPKGLKTGEAKFFERVFYPNPIFVNARENDPIWTMRSQFSLLKTLLNFTVRESPPKRCLLV